MTKSQPRRITKPRGLAALAIVGAGCVVAGLSLLFGVVGGLLSGGILALAAGLLVDAD